MTLSGPHLVGLGAFVLLAATALAMHSPGPKTSAAHTIPNSHVRLAAISTKARKDVDYATLDQRLQQLVEKPAMVGLAVGVVENGRITFLKGYGETVEGSDQPVTADTVFRWASVSKGLAATMVAKLAEEGKVNLNGPDAAYVPSLRLPSGAEKTATVGDMLCHRLGLYRNAYDNKLEEGQDPHFLRQTLGS